MNLCWWTINPRGYHPPSIHCFYHWVDTSAGGLLIPEGIIRQVVIVSITAVDTSAGGLRPSDRNNDYMADDTLGD
jgi:hypothetical protein